jgi:hypothetical protein
MKKIISIVLIGVLAIGFGALSFADGFGSPAETYADLKDMTVEDAYIEKGQNGTFGDLAKANGLGDNFSAAMIKNRTSVLQEKVESEEITQDQADTIITQMADCNGDGEAHIAQSLEMRFGADSETKGFYGEGNMAQSGTMNENAPRLGQEEGTPQARTANQSKDLNGTGSKFGQNR